MQIKRAFSFLFLLLPFGVGCQVFMRPFDPAPTMAMGGAAIAYPGMDAGWQNEAAPAWRKGRGVWLGSALPYALEGWNTASLQAYSAIDANSAVALDLAHNGTEFYAEQRLRLAYSRRLGLRFTLGGSLDAMRVDAPEYGSATAATFGLGVLAEPVPRLWLGARIQNPLQAKIGDHVLPTVVRIGAAWRSSASLLWLLDAEKDLERRTQLRVGFEYKPLPALALRAGVRSAPGRASLGAGFTLKNGLALHAAAEWHPALGVTPAAAISWEKKAD